MARFSYQAYDDSGVKRKGELEAESLELANQQLESDGFLVTKIRPVQAQSLSLSLSNKPKLADIEYFTSELSLLLQSGLRVDKGIDILVRNSSNPRLIPILRRISQGLKSGQQLSDTLSKEKSAFDELYVSLVRVGEESGDLVGVFDRLANDLKERRELQSVIQQALVYPAVILAVCVISVLFIFNYVVPNLTSLFSDTVNLPWYTEALLGVSEWVQNYQVYAGVVVVFVLVAVTRYRDHPMVFKATQWMKDRVIGVKKLSVLAERARFAGGLSVMLNSGLALDRAVKLAINIVQQESVKQQLKLAHERLKRGTAFSDAFGSTSLFTDYYRSLIVVGEESGEMARVFNEISQRSRKDLNAWVKRFTTLLEPLMILTMGAIVGTVVVVMMLSINAITDVQI